eukprot:5793276-Prymnesium_polylepis.1
MSSNNVRDPHPTHKVTLQAPTATTARRSSWRSVSALNDLFRLILAGWTSQGLSSHHSQDHLAQTCAVTSIMSRY